MNNVQVFFCKPNKFDECLANKLVHFLNDQEKKHYSKLRFEQDRYDYVISHALLRYAVFRYSHVFYSDLGIDFTPNKAPKIKKPNNLRSTNITLSRTKELVVCAISCDSEIGIDVEYIENRDYTELFPYCLNVTETTQVRSNTKKAESFLRIWTMKEAFLKGKGIGLKESPLELESDLKRKSIKSRSSLIVDINNWGFVYLNLSSDYICSLAINSGGGVKKYVKTHRISSNDLLYFFKVNKHSC